MHSDLIFNFHFFNQLLVMDKLDVLLLSYSTASKEMEPSNTMSSSPNTVEEEGLKRSQWLPYKG